jgi:hypothetical protein
MLLNLIATTLLSASPTAQATPLHTDHAVRITDQSANLLGNGGFESWGLGVSNGGPIPPELWYPMGSPANLFSQGAIQFSQEPASTPALGGTWCVRAQSSAPGNYFSQTLETGAEFAGAPVTFSVDFVPYFAIAQAKIEIFDGVTSSSEMQNITARTRLSVQHMLSPSATKLEFRIYPIQTVFIDNAMGVFGEKGEARYIARANPEPGVMELPLGAVVDWYRFDVNVPVPEGYALCDGSLITDGASPFVGLPTVDLRDRFVRGASSLGGIGAAGGADSVNLAHTHGMSHTHNGTTGPSSFNGFNFWIQQGGFGTPALDSHHHSFTTGGPSTASTSSALGVVSTVPSYVGLLKIVRIK